MITLMELYNVASLPLVDMETRDIVDSKVVLKHPDARVEVISCNDKFDLLVKYEKEPEDET